MKLLISCSALAVLLSMLGASAFADTMAKPDAMAAKPSPTMATLLCRPAMHDEKPSAMMGTSALVCKKVDMATMTSMKNSLQAMPGGEPLYLKMFQEYHIDANGV